jgi:hypothetical protein
VPEGHDCNPSYSGGRDQEDHSSKSAQDYLENPSQKRAGAVPQGVSLSSSPSTEKKKQKKTIGLKYLLKG